MVASRAFAHVERQVGRLALAGFRHPWPFLATVAVSTLVAFLASSRLTLRADLSDLLPRSFRSVRDLDLLAERAGGMGYGVVVGQGAQPEALRRFARDLAPKLEALPGVRFVNYERPSAFFRDRALYFMALSDIQEIERRIRERRDWEQLRRHPLYVPLDDEPAPPLDLGDIERKYQNSSVRRFSGDRDETFILDADQRMVVLLAKPMQMSTDLAYAKQFVGELDAFLKTQDFSAYGPDFTVSLTGTFKKKIDQQRQIRDDVATASTVAALLILLYLVFHFRGLLPVLLVLAPVGVGLLWTYGLVGVVWGEVNLLTAFLGAILGGLGTEHGIHLLGRYGGLRAEGRTEEEAVHEAFCRTGASAIVSALVAACAFASMSISEFRPFREFGVIAAAGMLLLVFACLWTLPAALGAALRIGWTLRAKETIAGQHSRLAAWLPRAPGKVALALGVPLLLLALDSPRAPFTYDLGVLQDMQLPSFRLDSEVNRILGYSQIPVIILTASAEEDRLVEEQIAARKRQLGTASTIDFVASLSDLVPADQAQKHRAMQSIRHLLEAIDRDDLDRDLRRGYDDLMRLTAPPPFARSDIPASIRRQFEGLKPSAEGYVLVFPSVNTDDGKNVRALAAEVRDLQLPGGRSVNAVGEVMVLADILDMVTREAPPVIGASVLLVLVAMWLTLGRLSTALACLAPTVVSILALLGLLPVVNLKLNFLNIVAIPALIGTTVDGGVHLLSRLRDARADFNRVLGETGRAIGGGLLTSAFGFAAMVFADHPGLSSLGKLTILGFTVNAVVMLVAFPAVLLVVGRKRG
ncbi:MAG TPA: MMPL family transporter [Myxococcales bacterium]|jgi:hypothetical protein